MAAVTRDAERGAVSVRGARSAQAGGAGRRPRLDRPRGGRPARRDAGVHPRRRARGGRSHVVVPARGGSAGAARGDRGVGGSAVRRDARPVDRPDPHARQQGADLLARAGGPGPGGGPRPRAGDRARIHDPRARRAVRRGRGGAPAAGGARLPARPRRRSTRPTVGAGGDPVAQLPEQPDRRHGAAGVPRARRRPGAPSRRPAGARRGVQRAVVRRRASGLGPAARRPHERRRAQHAEQALEHDGVPLGVHGRRRRG